MYHSSQPPSEKSSYEWSTVVSVERFSDGCVLVTVTYTTTGSSAVFDVKYATNISNPQIVELCAEGLILWAIGAPPSSIWDVLEGIRMEDVDNQPTVGPFDAD